MEQLAIPLSRQKTAASGWLSRAGGNPVIKLPAQQDKIKFIFDKYTGFPPARE